MRRILIVEGTLGVQAAPTMAIEADFPMHAASTGAEVRNDVPILRRIASCWTRGFPI